MDYLLTLPSVRDRSTAVFNQAKVDKLTNFTADFEKLPAVAEYVHKLIERDYQSDASRIPLTDDGNTLTWVTNAWSLIESWEKKESPRTRLQLDWSICLWCLCFWMPEQGPPGSTQKAPESRQGDPRESQLPPSTCSPRESLVIPIL